MNIKQGMLYVKHVLLFLYLGEGKQLSQVKLLGEGKQWSQVTLLGEGKPMVTSETPRGKPSFVANNARSHRRRKQCSFRNVIYTR